MINRKELTICKRRGHEPPGLGEGWRRCMWCGIWQRTVTTVEEREDEPPKDEQSPYEALQDMARNKRRK